MKHTENIESLIKIKIGKKIELVIFILNFSQENSSESFPADISYSRSLGASVIVTPKYFISL